MAIPNIKGHIVVYALPAWGHNKPLVALVARLVRLSHIHVTFFTGVSLYDRVLRELKKQFLPQGEESLKSLIRVVGLSESPIPLDHDTNKQAFAKSYEILSRGEPIPATPDGTLVHAATRLPQLVILDFFCYESLKAIRQISGNTVPIYAWQSGATTGIIYLFGPEHLGGTGDLAKKLDALAVDDESARFAEAQKLYSRINGELIKLPGLPPMYDHEFMPQKFPVPIDVAKFSQYTYRMFVESDGSIHCTHLAYEGSSLDAWSEWLPHGPVIPVGAMQTPPELAKIHDTRELSDVEIEVESFLNDAFSKYGENSVIYISFGTIFWSTEPEKIWAVIDVLIEMKIPFLFAHASPFASVTDETKQKVADSGLGYMSNWLPQQMILNHRACGWFLSHGGHNSTMEALCAGVPLIFWPFQADQPMNAVLVSIVHDAGYELIETRQDVALRPMHRLGGRTPEGTVDALRKEATEVFTKARGEDGKIRRMNAQKLGKQLVDYWAPGGAGWRELQRIIDVLN